MDNRELFIDFYNNSHNCGDIDPNIELGQYICNRFEFNKNQRIWFSFLNAITYQFATAYAIIQEFPDCELAGIRRLEDWWTKQQYESPFQRDKLKQRKYLPETVASYKELINGSESEYFDNLLNRTPTENFEVLWNEVYKPIRHFGRFSVWNWAQNLRDIAGYDIRPHKLFLGDKNAESITHGMCHVMDWQEKTFKKRWKDENGKKHKEVYLFSDDEKFEMEAQALWIENNTQDSEPFKIETVLCAYKKLWRERDSRYIGYYLDRQAEDIQKTMEKEWHGVDWRPLIEGRQELFSRDTEQVSVDKSKFKLIPKEKVYVECNRNSSITGRYRRSYMEQ